MSDVLFRGRGTDVGVRAPVWLVRLAGALVGLLVVELADALGVWEATGASRHVVRLLLMFLGALVAPSSIGAGLWLLAGAVTTVFMLVLYTPLVAPLAPLFVRRDAPGPPPDAILVFSGAVTSSGRVTGAALERLLDAMQVARSRRIPSMGLSVLGDERDARTPTSERDQRLLLELGVPGIDARFVRDVHSTRDEALAFAALARTHGWRRVLAITSPSHTRRACGALEAVGLSVECRPATARLYDLSRLDRPDNRRLAFADVLYEATATALYRARDWMR
jgi:uncharacterized SAM-binding protein YcdF (DUF218 family)